MAASRPLFFLPFFLLSLLPCSSFATPESNGHYEIKYYTQLVDHFSFRMNEPTYQQRYLLNATYWGGAASGAPIFVNMGGEDDIEHTANHQGFMFDTAPYFKSLLVFIEHRYYGQSLPNGTVPDSYSTSLRYLSVPQALADYATLIIDLKKNLSAERSPVIVVGGSYAGMLAAWFRLKYPHVALGALSSSAPILLNVETAPSTTYNDVISRTYMTESESCYNVIRHSWEEFARVQEPKKLAKLFKICRNRLLAKDKIIEAIIMWLRGTFELGAVRDYPTVLDPKGFPAYPVKKMCTAINNPERGNDTFARLYDAMNAFYNHTGDLPCFNVRQQVSSETGWGQYDFQLCAELVLATEGGRVDGIHTPLVFNYTHFRTDYCYNNHHLVPRQRWLTTEFGGHDIRRVLKRFGSNIIFFNGLRDPWSSGGILVSLSHRLPAIVAPKGCHCVDLRYSAKEDPRWLRTVRSKEIRIISHWLEEYRLDGLDRGIVPQA